jgi:nucleotide sugar dehydrogenase
MQRLKVAPAAPPARFAERTAVVAVVGLGKIGLPLAIQYVQRGRHVIGCDVNPRVVETINAGHTHVQEEPGLDSAVAEAVTQGALSATVDTTAAVRQADVVVVIVPVMVTDGHAVDFRAIDCASVAVGAGLAPRTLVIYETTLPVGTTAGRLRTLLEHSSQLQAGRDFYLAYSPERVSSGRIFHDLTTYPKVVGGFDADSARAATIFYGSVLDAEVTQMASASDAEFVKLIETTYRDVNIALANEFARYADRRGLDVAAAIAAANTQPYSHIHNPGVGVGGHCIPVYPYFLMHDTNDVDRELTLPQRARIINDEMAAYAVQRIEGATGSIKGSAVLILGVAYRGDVREHAFSSARLLQSALQARGARIWAVDPLFEDRELAAMGYTPFSSEWSGEVQAIILQADHQAFRSFDVSRYPNCRVVLDGRWAMSPKQIRQIKVLGMEYLRIGSGQGAAVSARERGAR